MSTLAVAGGGGERPCPVLLLAYHLDQGGCERQLAETARALDRSRFRAHVGAFRPGGLRWRELEASGVQLVHFSVPSLASIGGLHAIGRYIRRHGIRLVHTFDTPANLYGVPAARLAGCARVLSSQRSHRSLEPWVRLHGLRFVDKLVDAVLVNCEFIRNSLIEEERVPVSRIRLCHNGIDTNVFHMAERARPAALQGASLVVGVVCALRPEKDLATLLAGFSRVRGRLPGARLVIVGSGPCLPDLQRRAEDLGILGECVFQPATPNVTEWLHGIDIFVLPSRTEALSNALMEAMACGCCVVASRVGGNPELVDAQTGVLFDPGDVDGLAAALLRLADQPAHRELLVRNAAARIQEKFRLERAGRRMADIYQGLIAEGAVSASGG